MLITEVENLSRTKVKIYIDETYAFALSKNEADSLCLEPGCELSEETYNYIFKELLLKKAKLKSLSLLKARDYTENELILKLRHDLYPEPVIRLAVDYVKSYRYIDDERYIENFCRLNQHRLSRQQLIYKLHQKGLDSGLISSYMSGLEIDEQAQILSALRSKYGRQLPKDAKGLHKVYGYLLRKGYRYDDIRQALKAFDEQDTD